MKTNLSKFFINSSDENIFEYKVHGVTFKLKPASRANKEFIEATARHSLILNDKVMEYKDDERELAKINFNDDMHRGIIVDSILVGWEGLLDENDKELPFTKENALNLLKEIPDFINELTNAASDKDNFSVIDEKK
jgi:hypothetical protein